MNSLRFITVAISLALVSISCSKTGTQSKTSTAVEVPFSVTPGSLVFTKDGGTQTLTVKTGENWTTSIDATWMKLSKFGGAPMDGTIDVTVPANMDEARTATITFSSGGRSASVSVSQDAGYSDDGIKKVSIAEFRGLKDSSTDWYRISGEVVSIADQEYGDMYLYDGTGYVYVYGLAPEKGGRNEDFSKLGIKAGDSITIIAHKKKYNSVIETDKAYLENKQAGMYPGVKAGKTTAGYIELPATSEKDALTYLCHYDGKGKRNYSAYFDTEKRLSSWVCFPFCSSDKSDPRPDSYAYDPLIASEYQADITRSFQNRTFDGEEFVRGHMLPNAARGGRRQLDAFLSTNIMPQSSEINVGIWSSLEERERVWVKKCDTLYVVVGTDCSGSRYQVLDNSAAPKQITVPGAIYRAVLAYNKKDNSYVGIAAYFENRKNAESVFAKTLPGTMLMSIDKLEQKLGIDLFVNLPGAVGESKANAIEAANPAEEPFWWTD